MFGLCSFSAEAVVMVNSSKKMVRIFLNGCSGRIFFG